MSYRNRDEAQCVDKNIEEQIEDGDVDNDGPSDLTFNIDEAAGQLDGQKRKVNRTRTIKCNSKRNTSSNPSRKKPDQELVHKYAKMIHNPAQKHVFNALDRKLKARVLKFVKIEEELIDFCRKYEFSYEEPSSESDYTRRQRLKCRIKYHVKKGNAR